jgi:hypothetical protein
MIARKSPHAVQVLAPTCAACAGGAPHRSRLVALLLTSCAGVAAVLPACANNDANQVMSPIVLGMTSTIAPFYSDGEIDLYQVQTPVALPVRRATDDELKFLGKAEPYPRAPFLLASDTRVEIRFTLSNLDDTNHNVELLLDPWNEFVRYRPGVQVVNDEVTLPNVSGYDRLIVVPAKSRVLGTITTDDTNELAVDLATAEAILANPPSDANGGVKVGQMINHVFDFQNRSTDGDPLITRYIPKVIAGLTGFDLGIRTTREQANVAVEIVVDITDLNGNRVIPTGGGEKPIGEPSRTIEPPASGGGN